MIAAPHSVRLDFWRRRALLRALGLTVALPGLTQADDAASLSFDTLYRSVGVLGIQYSDLARSLVGREVHMRGYMAPPLKPEARFFVLTREPVAVCPFCSSDAQWPVDIVVIYLRETLKPISFTRRIDVRGRLQLGSWTDPDTGFVSQVRLVESDVIAP